MEAKNLPNMDMFHKKLGDMFSRIPGKVSSKIDGKMSKITSDPYVTVSAAGAVVGRSSGIEYSENPLWGQQVKVNVAHYVMQFLASILIVTSNIDLR